MIDSKDISVVVQGAINKEETPKCLSSIRKYLPNAEIILSTWEGSDVTGLDYDILVFNQDPQAFVQLQTKKKTYYNNLNRQLLSTQNGLKKVERKYAMKFRSDLILSGTMFLKYFDMFQARTDKYNLFNRKILTSTLFTRYEQKFKKEFIKIPFHISDWWFFGLTEDIKKYFLDTPLVEEPSFTYYFNLPENQDKVSPYNKNSFKFAPEQYFGYTPFANNFEDIYMEDSSDTSDELFEKFRHCLINNFIILENKQSGIYLNKYCYSKNEKMLGENYLSLYTFARFEMEYKQLCDNNYILNNRNYEVYNNKKKAYRYGQMLKHYYAAFMPNVKFLKRLEELFISFPFYAIIYLLKK